ncbi:Hypothetical predicted protein [Cloeon dipterum]|uniref:Peptidase S1 domain-containing protein n=1 Tax=Cloeon dipterum TaxID=197152 RepID=A0A8S1CM07_9INSE|nr:Hypothetical predicted protein [Cloeon dipterum]
MTAAHCASGCSTFEVRAGALRNEGGQNVISKHAIVHENYDSRLLNNDIALIMLPEDLTGENIGAFRLPSFSMIGLTFAGRKARVSGWGRTSDSSNGLSKDLKFVDVIVIPNYICEQMYAVITYSQMCAGTNWGTVGVCYGDSGGPMTVFESDGKATQIGIASFVSTRGRCQHTHAHGFTRVTEFLYWVERNAGVKIRQNI